MSRRRRQSTRTWRVLLIDPPWKYDNYGMAKHGAQRAHYKGMTTAELCALPVGDLGADRSLCFVWGTGPKEAEGAHVELLTAWGYRPVTAVYTWVKVYPSCEACGHHWNAHEPTEYDVPGECKDSRCVRGRGDGSRVTTWSACRGFSPKLYMGTGCYTGGGTERVWLGVRGSGWSRDRFEVDVRHTVIAPLPCYPGTQKKMHSAKPEEIARRIARQFPGPYLEIFARRARRGWDVWGNEAPDPVACVLDA